MWPSWILGIVVCIVTFIGIETPAWGQQWQEVAGELMSPACPGRTLLNCTSSQAEQWRELIRQKLTSGESKDQVLQYFVEMNGEAILAAPPKKGFALTAWLLPFFLFLNGAGLIIVLTRRWAQKRPGRVSPDVALSPSTTHDADPYVHRLRSELRDFDS
ncbi:MAG: cytochrome c-type biogenesis protein CcmH [Candidatus Tectimicrobiota bacterium]